MKINVFGYEVSIEKKQKPDLDWPQPWGDNPPYFTIADNNDATEIFKNCTGLLSPMPPWAAIKMPPPLQNTEAPHESYWDDVARYAKRYSIEPAPSYASHIAFNIPIARLEDWTEETLEQWLRLTGTPEAKIKETALDIRLQAQRSGVSLKQPRRTWHKFSVGENLTLDELLDQKAAIAKLLGFRDADYFASRNYFTSPKNGINLTIFYTVDGTGHHWITSIALYSENDESLLCEFPVVDGQLDIDEIEAAIAKLSDREPA
jgi:hypothetical protein